MHLMLLRLEQVGSANKEGYEGVARRHEQESDEVAHVSATNACADPWAVMVVDLHAEAADSAVEGSWRPQYLARLTVRQLIVLVGLIFNKSTFFIALAWLELEFHTVIKFLWIVLLRHHFLAQYLI